MPTQRVLVVEDEDKLCQLLKELLEPEYRVIVANDGIEGLMLGKAVQPTAILLDIGLPRLDGLSVLRLLKLSPETARIPVIVISACAASTALADAKALGACAYLIKPFSLDALRSALHQSTHRTDEAAHAP